MPLADIQLYSGEILFGRHATTWICTMCDFKRNTYERQQIYGHVRSTNCYESGIPKWKMGHKSPRTLYRAWSKSTTSIRKPFNSICNTDGSERRVAMYIISRYSADLANHTIRRQEYLGASLRPTYFPQCR